MSLPQQGIGTTIFKVLSKPFCDCMILCKGDMQQCTLCFVSAGWSGCQLGANATCGHGERRRLLSCRRSDGATVSMQLCQQVSRAGTHTQGPVLLESWWCLLIHAKTFPINSGKVLYGAGAFGKQRGVSGWCHSLTGTHGAWLPILHHPKAGDQGDCVLLLET